MQVGIVYPQTELRGDPAALLAYGLAAEQLGLSHLVSYDHPLGAQHGDREPRLTGPYTEADPFHDPLMMFAYLAGVTRRLQFISGVMVLPQRQTALVARQAADLDLVSGGRFTLGAGVGWNFVEYEALGADFHTRGRKLDEQIGLLRQLWSGEVVDFSGRFHRVDRAAINPAPRRRIPIHVGGFADAAFRRGARLGDGFIFGNGYGDVFECLDRVERYLAEAGRSAATFGKHLILNNLPTLAAMVERALAWRDRGGTAVSIEPMRRGLDSPERHLAFMREANDAFRQAGLGASADAS